jgi:hypothetical protein
MLKMKYRDTPAKTMTACALAGSPTGSFRVSWNAVRAAEGNYIYRPVVARFIQFYKIFFRSNICFCFYQLNGYL